MADAASTGLDYPPRRRQQSRPEQHGEALAHLIESDVRSRGFATVKPVLPGSAVLEFRDFVWNRSI